MFSRRNHTDRSGRGPLCPTTLRSTILALSFLFAAPHASALLDKRCAKEGGDLECVPPNQDPKVCVGGASIASSDPPCGLACNTPGLVIDAVSANWVKTFPLCSALEPMPCRDVTTQPNTETKYMGLVIRHELSFDAKSACNDNPSAYVTNCAGGDGLAIDCKAPVICPPTYGADLTINMCTRPRPKACPAGNPIQCAGGQKLQHESDIPSTGPGTLSLSHHYSSSGFYNSSPSKRNFLGPNWRHSYQRTLQLETATAPNTLQTAFLVRADGKYSDFRLVNGAWVGRKDQWENLEEIIDQGVRTGWRYTTPEDEIEHYDLQGRLVSISTRSGLVTTLEYSTASTPASIAPEEGLLLRVTDALGRTLDFRYTKETYPGGVHHPRRLEIIDSIGNVIAYEFDPKERLVRTIYPEGKTRQYIYNETAPFTVSEGWHLLTGIIDENGQRFATYKYSGDGRAVEEWHGSSNADYLKVSYTAGFDDTLSKANLLDGLGSLTKRRFRFVNGAIRDEGVTRCDNPGCSSASLQKTTQYYDANGNPRLSIDYKGTITDYDYNDQALETARRENFSEGPTTCPAGTSADSNNYTSTCLTGTCWRTTPFTGSSNAAEIGWTGWHYSCRVPTTAGSYTRATETIWHASLRAPLERDLRNSTGAIESKTRWAYNSRGQTVARCEIDIADAAAMAYICSDTVAPSASAKVRRWTYSYCEATDVAAPNSTCPILGFAKTVNGPRAVTDPGMNGLDDITTYAYYPSTDESGCGTVGGICHRKGDLHTVTNALGHVVETVAYDKNGRAVRSRDPNGTITDVTYNSRGWLLSRTVRALVSGANNADDATTTFAYDNVGQVTRVTQPDGAYLNYSYDDAHRLTDIVDNLSNRIHYTLDAAGNRIKEETFDASYNPATPGVGLKRALSREYNALSRLIKEFNASGVATRDSTPYDSSTLSDGYDSRGNAAHFKNGLNVQTQRTFDALNRLAKTINDYIGSDPTTSNTTIEYSFDARNNIRTVNDPSGLKTTYSYDGFGNQIALDSPDSGHTEYGYDLEGNRTAQTDARGITSSYSYDALGRLVGIAYPTSSLNVVFQFDQPDSTTACTASFPIGRLTSMTDASGTTRFCYDRRGNTTNKNQVTSDVAMAIGYTYDKADRVNSITYPDGAVATYQRDSTGRPVALSWKATPSATTVDVIGNSSYYPFGPLHVLTFGSGRTLTKTYDRDYMISSVSSSANDGLKLLFSRDVLANITGLGPVLGASSPERTYEYDNLYRLKRVADQGGNALESYGYDKVGNRTSKTLAGQATQTYTYLSGSHRLRDVAGALRNYDANGNTLDRGDGIRLAYDDRNRLTDVGPLGNIASYNYSGLGERVFKARNNGVAQIIEHFVFGMGGQLLQEQRAVNGGSVETTSYLYFDLLPVAVVRGNSIRFLETDHLGTPRIAVNPSSGEKEWSWDLFASAFGENPPTALNGGSDHGLRFNGQRADPETGLSFNFFRNFDPTIGRYAESDPIGLAGGISTYAYVSGSPLAAADPFGLAQVAGSWIVPPRLNPTNYGIDRVEEIPVHWSWWGYLKMARIYGHADLFVNIDVRCTKDSNEPCNDNKNEWEIHAKVGRSYHGQMDVGPNVYAFALGGRFGPAAGYAANLGLGANAYAQFELHLLSQLMAQAGPLLKEVLEKGPTALCLVHANAQ